MPSVAPSVAPTDSATGQPVAPQANVAPEPRQSRKAKRTASAADSVGPGFTF